MNNESENAEVIPERVLRRIVDRFLFRGWVRISPEQLWNYKAKYLNEEGGRFMVLKENCKQCESPFIIDEIGSMCSGCELRPRRDLYMEDGSLLTSGGWD